MSSGTPGQTPPTNIQPSKPIGPGEEQPAEPGTAFKEYMQESKSQPGAGKQEGVSPFDLAAQGKVPGTGPTPDSLKGQMNSVSSVLGDVQNQLHTKNLNLKHSQKYLLRNKLTSANENIRSAAGKAGADVGPPPSTSSRQSPVAKFLSLVSDGQSQLANAQTMISNLGQGGSGPLNPGDLLMIQVKLARAQQELEYSSVLLSKAVDDIKTMFNIQL